MEILLLLLLLLLLLFVYVFIWGGGAFCLFNSFSRKETILGDGFDPTLNRYVKNGGRSNTALLVYAVVENPDN